MNRTIEYLVRKGALHPNTEHDRDMFEERYGEGEVVTLDTHPLQRKLWAICGGVIKERDGLPWSTAEELVDALKRAAGHVETGQTLGGKPYLFARSMGEVGDWPPFFNKCIDALAKYLDVDPKSLTEQEAGGSASSSDQGEDPAGTRPSSPDSDNPPAGSDQSETSGTEGQAREGSSPGSTTQGTGEEYSPKAFVAKMLELAGDPVWKGKTEEHVRQIDAIRLMWHPHLGDLGFGYKVSQTCILVAQGKLKLADAKRLLTAQIPST